jgi:type IV secretion system protein VirB9
MTLNRILLLCGPLALVVGAAPASSQAVKHSSASAPPTVDAAIGPMLPPTARSVSYNANDVVAVRTKLRYTTLIVLPNSEQILDYTCGDKEYWVIDGGNHNFAYIKPAKAGARTNLNLITASGNIYSFVLSEVSDTQAQPDLKLFVELKDEDMATAAHGTPRFVAVQDLEDIKQQLAAAKEEIRRLKESQESEIDKRIHQFVSNVRFDYRFEAGKKPFSVRSMYHDDRFTYIQARPEETPTVYEIKDGKPNLVTFQYRDGVYVIGKIVDKGYLAIGKQRLGFTREE